MSQSADLMTALAWSLLHFFWQGAAIAALAAVAMALFRESTTRYLIGVSALALMLMCFVLTFAYLRGASAGGAAVAADAALSRVDDAQPSADFAVPAFERPAAERDLAWVARGWLGVVCLLALRVACGLLVLELLRRRSLSALPAEIVERCLALQRRLGISRVVRYCECRLVTVPSVIGFLRPIVLLPIRALTGLSAEQLEAVIAHELAHIKRFDVVVNFLQVVVETLFFFHPAVWWLNKRIRADREDCCDDVAIAACGRKVDYVRALALMEGWRGTPELSMAATGGDVAGRVARLLGMNRQKKEARSAGVFTAALVLAAALTAGAASMGVARPRLATSSLPALQQLVAQVDSPLVAQAGSENRSRAGAARAPVGASPSTSFIDDMKSVGFDVTDVDLLIALKTHGVTADYVRGIRDAGLEPDVDEILAMKIHGVTPEYVAEVSALGIDFELDDVLAMRIHGITPEYIERIRALGFELDLDDVMALKIHGVTPEFINEARSHGFEDLSMDQIIQLKNAGVL
jgi:beta-lactamase regulating signal transducer with metallopeptidase domain